MPDDVLGELTWTERVIVRRVRVGWTKADLANACGISRVTLWCVLECMDPERRVEPSDRVKHAIEEALAVREAEVRDGATIYELKPRGRAKTKAAGGC